MHSSFSIAIPAANFPGSGRGAQLLEIPRYTTAAKLFRWTTVFLSMSTAAFCQVNVLTYHYDNFRAGANLQERILTPGNVKPDTFGKLFSQPVDGQIYAQPLELQDVLIPGKGRHDVVFVATENDSVYAFDADNNTGENANPLWSDSFINPSKGITPIPAKDTGTASIYPQVGITSTPVIDLNSGTLYVVAATKENGAYLQRLHALDVATGVEKFGGPIVIEASVPGTGWGSVHGMVSFNALRENQRAGLLLANGVVYIGWASHGLETTYPYHGWLIGYDAATLTQAAVFNVTPNGMQGGVWQSGGGIAADLSGNIYFVSGNGTFDVNTGGTDYGMSFVKLTTAAGLQVSDYFTPYNEAVLSKYDQDFGSGGPLLFPDLATAVKPHFAIGAGKNSVIYLLNLAHLGEFNSGKNDVVESIQNAFAGHALLSTPAFWQQKLYFAAANDVLRIFQYSDGLISKTPIATSSETFPAPGSTPVISSNGGTDGILWLVGFNPQGGGNGYGGPAVLLALNPTTAAELYSSTQAGFRDTPGLSIKFATPTIANGKVYFGTATELDVFGLLPNSAQAKHLQPAREAVRVAAPSSPQEPGTQSGEGHAAAELAQTSAAH